MKGNFNYPGKGGRSISKSKLGEKDFVVEGFGDSPVNTPKGKDEKSPGVTKKAVKTDRGSFKFK